MSSIRYMKTISQKRTDELRRLESFVPAEEDSESDKYGVLLSDQIKHLVDQCKLIDPYNPKNLKPAGYELTVGDEYYLGGEYHNFDEASHGNSIIIPPFEVAVIKTHETVCLPRFLIARWNLRVRHAYKGLLWVGAARVDPGYAGHLFCPIYNLSDRPVSLPKGENLALIDFVKTTPFDANRCEVYEPKNRRPIIEDFGVEDLKSALYTRAGQKIEIFEQTIGRLENRFATYATLNFIVLALIVSAGALIFQTDQDFNIGASLWSSILVAGLAFVLLITVIQFFGYRLMTVFSEDVSKLLGRRLISLRNILRWNWWIGFLLALIFAIVLGAGAYYLTESLVEDLRNREVVSRDTLQSAEEKMMKIVKETQMRTETNFEKKIDGLEAENTALNTRVKYLENILNSGSD